MGIGMIIIHKSLDGEEWSNNYACIVNAETTTPLQVDDFPSIGIGQSFTNAHTDPAHASYFGASYLLAAILGYERMLHAPQVDFVRLDLNDGQKDTDIFASVPLSFTGMGTVVGQDALSPGSITLLVSKVPFAYSVRSGRSFYRGVIREIDLRFAGRGGVDWQSAGLREEWQGKIDTAVTSSFLFMYMAAGENTDAQEIAIPHYAPSSAAVPGNLVSATAISNFVVQKPVSRQMKKGKRRGTSQPE